MDKDIIARASKAQTPEELMAIAQAGEIELTEESAKAYFAQLHPQTGELGDDELEDVAGGKCYNKGRPVVTVGEYCDRWTCKKDGADSRRILTFCKCNKCGCRAVCNSCRYCGYEKGLWLCNHPRNQK